MIDLNGLYKIQNGMYIITSVLGDKINGQLATTVMQVTCHPAQITACISKETLTHDYITHSRVFGVSILDNTADIRLIGHFGFKSGRNLDKFKTIPYEKGLTGCPLVINNTLVTMEASVRQAIDLKTHTLFIGELESAKTIRDGEAMTYEYYHTVLKGKSPANAPTYQCHIDKQ